MSKYTLKKKKKRKVIKILLIYFTVNFTLLLATL